MALSRRSGNSPGRLEVLSHQVHKGLRKSQDRGGRRPALGLLNAATLTMLRSIRGAGRPRVAEPARRSPQVVVFRG